eukprot:CAMPEP_0197865244 /NCGR_PEP_ID=MMETSP1438-20131217/43554_1 /TAXON_ID=1461541 /ORGANISM="Pterosperma sp., Strain CCMP1384" /LENGTH=290 /DNA_ID=CAMNT_0043483679 /DNA_START=262 /DNA_END=1131 /DNA_ORIENTATION=-
MATGEYEPIEANEKQILLQLGLMTKYAKKPVYDVKPPKFVEDGFNSVAVADRQPPLQGLDTCEHAMRQLVRHVEQSGVELKGACCHGFAHTELHGRHCIAVNFIINSRKEGSSIALKKNNHRKDFRHLQQVLYQLGSAYCRAIHKSDAAINYGLHSLEVTKETKDDKAAALAMRSISLAYNSKKMSGPAGTKKYPIPWKIQKEADKFAAQGCTQASLMHAKSVFQRTIVGDASSDAASLADHYMKEEKKRKELAAAKKEKMERAASKRKEAEEVEKKAKMEKAASAKGNW